MHVYIKYKYSFKYNQVYNPTYKYLKPNNVLLNIAPKTYRILILLS